MLFVKPQYSNFGGVALSKRGGFKDIPFIRDMPDRVFTKVNKAQMRQHVLRAAKEPVENRSYMGIERYFIEGKDGRMIEVSASGLTLSKAHVGKVDVEKDGDCAEMMILFPEDTVSPAKQYGRTERRPIHDMGVKVGEQSLKMVKLKACYSDIRFLASGKDDTRRQGAEIFYELEK